MTRVKQHWIDNRQNLTTLSNLKSSALSHLVELAHLESLEVGDCVEWTAASDYQVLGQLSHLKHLRLEQGPSANVVQHLEAPLADMSNLQHLELVNFTITAPLENVKLAGLKRLLIIPSYSVEVTIV